MKFSLSWLREHLDFTASCEEICARLNGIGLEVESVENPAEKLAGFRTAKILEAHRHPDADRLQLCRVAAGAGYEDLQVVCGAPNARAGLHVIFAPPGTYVPGLDITIKKGKIRGEESGGMLCSLRELGLGEESNGIAELPETAPIGEAYATYAELDDPVIEIAITPNRGDALSIRGIARDLAAAGIGHLKPWLTEALEGDFGCAGRCSGPRAMGCRSRWNAGQVWRSHRAAQTAWQTRPRRAQTARTGFKPPAGRIDQGDRRSRSGD